MAFTRKLLSVTFILGKGAFGEDGSNTVQLDGLRMRALVTKSGGPSMANLDLEVYGMERSTMNRLSTLGMKPQAVRLNTVILQAGEEGGALSTVYAGTIANAWVDFQSIPDVAFRVSGQTGLIQAVSNAPPAGYTGATDVAVIMKTLAAQMKLTFENNDVHVFLSNPYFYGSPRNQAMAAARAANIDIVFDNGTLAIWPRGQGRSGSVPVVSSETGMVGWPTYTSTGITVRTLYNPAIDFGGKINVQSDFDEANGDWIVNRLDYSLSTRFPNGEWFSVVDAVRPGFYLGGTPQ